jgi:hypothetical protein
MGQGYLASWTAFLGIVLGFGAVELSSSFLPGVEAVIWQGASLPSLLGLHPLTFALLVVGLALVVHWAWARRKSIAMAARGQGGITWASPVVGGALIALLNAVYFVACGSPLGLVGWVSVPFTVGATLSARIAGRFRFRRPTREQAVRSPIGGTMMGAGTSAMRGCNVTHVLGGVPQFSLASIVATASIVAGAWLGAKVVIWLADRRA